MFLERLYYSNVNVLVQTGYRGQERLPRPRRSKLLILDIWVSRVQYLLA